MGRFLNSLLGRLILSILGINLLLAPVLYAQLARITHETESELFVNDVRAYARVLAGVLELEVDRVSREDVVDILDSVALGRDTVFASLTGSGLDIQSALTETSADDYREDFSFGEHGDDAYYLSLPIASARYADVVLRLGFDETPTLDSIARARQRIILALALFLLGSLVAVILLAHLTAKPLRALQSISQRIADGQLEEPFKVDTRVSEIRELADDLNKMRANLVMSNERLRNEVAERDSLEKSRAELQNTLRHVQRLETIGTLAGGISHELNNVLQPIQFYTEIAIEGAPEGSPLRDDLQRILKLVGRAKAVVEQILTFSRRSHDEHFELVEVGPIVEDVGKLCRDLFPASVDVQVTVDAGCRPTFADAAQLHQLIMNLCNNAYHSLPSQAGSVSVHLSETQIARTANAEASVLRPGDYLQIDVVDTGQGMDSVTLERAFEPFFTTRGPHQGTGLGLSVAHGIVTAHRGAISVDSEPGKGSRFRVYLPITAAKGDHSGEALQRYRGRQRIYVSTSGVDQDIRDVIEGHEFRAVTMQSLAEIGEVLRSASRRNSLVVMDLRDSDLMRELASIPEATKYLESPHVLVVVPLDAIFKATNLDWSRIRHLVQPFSRQDFRSAVERLEREMEEADSEEANEPSAGH